MVEARRLRSSLRFRLVLAAMLAVTVILVVGGAALNTGLRSTLTASAVDSAKLRAGDLSNLAAAGSLPDPIPILSEEEELVQIVDAAGVVLAASANIEGEDPLPFSVPDPGEILIYGTTAEIPIGDEGPYRVVVARTDTPSGPVTVFVAISLHEVGEVVGTTARLGLAGLPVLVLLLGWLVWVLVGRTLLPVEAIRREADIIGGSDLHRRVPVSTKQDEIARLAGTVNNMLGRLEASAERQRRFVGDAAHELRSPIASLRTQLETARATPRPVDWEDLSNDMLDDTLRMQDLTEQLLVLARVEAGGSALRRGAVDLDDLAETAVSAANVRWPDVVFHLPPNAVQVVADEILVGQVVRNLVDNAARHATSEVWIRLAETSDDATVTVEDDGQGIPVADRDQIFSRFTRLDDARSRDAGGAGLGLAIVHDIVTAHGGKVAVTDRPGGGAVFTVSLPLDQG